MLVRQAHDTRLGELKNRFVIDTTIEKFVSGKQKGMM
jgi:hypothetical protein